MKVETGYHADWQNNRMDFILSHYPKEFFKGKRVLELGAYNGFFSENFRTLGAEVLCVEGRPENVTKIRESFPELNVECYNLDTEEWPFGHWDIIINFGLYYHLENFHVKHMENCINNCDLMLFESVIYDSNDDEIYFKMESGDDQSLSPIGGSPSTSYVENLLDKFDVSYEKFSTKVLNGNAHHYDWPDTGMKFMDPWARRFWIIKKK